MNRDEVLTLVREHLAEELEVDIERIDEETRFKEDLDADSLDLYELVMELEDRYGVAVSEEQATRIKTVGDAVGFVRRARAGLRRWRRSPSSAVAALAALIDELPDGPAPAGADPLLLDRAPGRLLRAPRLPRRQRPRPRRRHRALRALRRSSPPAA